MFPVRLTAALFGLAVPIVLAAPDAAAARYAGRSHVALVTTAAYRVLPRPHAPRPHPARTHSRRSTQAPRADLLNGS